MDGVHSHLEEVQESGIEDSGVSGLRGTGEVSWWLMLILLGVNWMGVLLGLGL